MDWERFNDQFRETEEERNERLRELRQRRAKELARAIREEARSTPAPSPEEKP